MKGEFIALNCKVKDHKKKARLLLDGGSKLPYELSSTMGALCTAYFEWDEKRAAFYAVELYALVEQILAEKEQAQNSKN
jgi:hypothetical protein